ncbi:MAG: hypothetical protein HYY09_02765 [Firmicutes bacterium]|nr:hypothetical protein [Bacillota bacterium]
MENKSSRKCSRMFGRWFLVLMVAVALLTTACASTSEPKGEGTGIGGSADGANDSEDQTPIVSGTAWVGPLVKLNGTIYILSKESLSKDQVGTTVGSVRRQLEMETDLQDGDSNFLPPATKLYSVIGRTANEALAIQTKGEYRVLKPGLGPGEIGYLN